MTRIKRSGYIYPTKRWLSASVPIRLTTTLGTCKTTNPQIFSAPPGLLLPIYKYWEKYLLPIEIYCGFINRQQPPNHKSLVLDPASNFLFANTEKSTSYLLNYILIYKLSNTTSAYIFTKDSFSARPCFLFPQHLLLFSFKIYTFLTLGQYISLLKPFIHIQWLL